MIIFDQENLWLPRHMHTVYCAADIVGAALMLFTGETPDIGYTAVFTDQHFRFTKTLKYHAHSSGNVIRYRHPDFVGIALTVHELGHTFDRLAKLQPQSELALDGLDIKAGSLWPGMHPPSLEGYTHAEKWANMFADWCMGMLAQNAVGKRLEKFMTDGMPAWCALAMGKG